MNYWQSTDPEYNDLTIFDEFEVVDYISAVVYSYGAFHGRFYITQINKNIQISKLELISLFHHINSLFKLREVSERKRRAENRMDTNMTYVTLLPVRRN